MREVELHEVIESRRAYRSLDLVEIDEGLVEDLAYHASLAPSCYNNQPWRFIFVYEEEMLQRLKAALSRGNEWAYKASMIIAVLSREDYDCIIGSRRYYLFDMGIAAAFLILRATDLGLVAHPIAGYDPEKVKSILGIPEDMEVITLIILGKHKREIDPILTPRQRESEAERPPRKSLSEFAFLNHYSL
ncbi:MAG: nitroreductase family protein [Candidatus Bathyarchaeia archaeon]